MTIGRFRLNKEWKQMEGRKPDELMEVPGSLGITKGGTRQVEVSGRDGYVYVRIRDQLSEVVQVYNDQVSPVYDLPVIITRNRTDMNRWRIKGKDLGRYGNWGSTAYLPNHAGQHSFDPDAPGADLVWIYSRQFMPLAPTPSGSSGAMSLIVKDFTYEDDSVWHYFPDTTTSSFVSYKPAGSNAAMVLLYLKDTDVLGYLKGSEFAIVTGSANLVPHIPTSPADCLFPIAGIYLVSGTSHLDWDNIYDARAFYRSATTGSSGSGTDEKVKVSSNDTTAGYLQTKLVAGVGITLTEVDDGGNETLQVASSTYTGTSTFNDIFPVTVPPASGYTWYNEGDATVTYGTRKLTLFDPGHTDGDWHILGQSLPTGTVYKRTVGIFPNMIESTLGLGGIGIVIRDTTGSKFINLVLNPLSGGYSLYLEISVKSYSDVSTVVDHYDEIISYFPTPIYLQIENDGVNVYYRYSNDGTNFRTLYQHVIDTFVSPNQFGYSIRAIEYDVWSTIISYLEG
jgi:hypothetical protein